MIYGVAAAETRFELGVYMLERVSPVGRIADTQSVVGMADPLAVVLDIDDTVLAYDGGRIQQEPIVMGA